MNTLQKPPKETWISAKVKIQNSPTDGQGMFAVEKITKNEPVLIWGGEYVNKEKANRVKKEEGLIMQWDEDLYSIEERGEDQGYFLNHSCNPNVWMEGAYTLIARRNIEVGEEVTADYALWESDENYVSKWTCHCAAEGCRKKVTGKDWQRVELQTVYQGHFSPLLNKRIVTGQPQ